MTGSRHAPQGARRGAALGALGVVRLTSAPTTRVSKAVKDAAVRVGGILGGLRAFTPSGAGNSTLSLIERSLELPFLLEGGEPLNREQLHLRESAVIALDDLTAAHGLSVAGGLLPIIGANADDLIRDPEIFLLPEPLVAWIRLILPKNILVEDFAPWFKRFGPTAVFEDEPDLIWLPKVLFDKQLWAEVGDHYFAEVFRRPASVSPEAWAGLKREMEEAFGSSGPLRATQYNADENLIKGWVRSAKNRAGAVLDLPEYHAIRTAQLVEAWERYAPKELSLSPEAAKLPDLTPLAGYEEAFRDLMQKRDAWLRTRYKLGPKEGMPAIGPMTPRVLLALESPEGTSRTVDEADRASSAALAALGPLYLGLPRALDPDQHILLVPPLSLPGVPGELDVFFKLIGVNPFERPRLDGGIAVLNDGVEIEAGFAEDRGLPAGKTSAELAYGWDWADIFARFQEDDDEKIEASALDEFDALCWPLNTGWLKEDALTWLEIENRRRQAAGRALWPDDWSGAVLIENAKTKQKFYKVSAYSSPFPLDDIPPQNVRIALGQLVFADEHCDRAGFPASVLPLWFLLACRRDGVPTGTDFVGQTRLQLFDWLESLTRGQLPIVGTELQISVGLLGALYETPDRKKSSVEAALRLDEALTTLGRRKDASFLPLTADPSDCRRAVGRLGACYRYDPLRDPDLVAILPDPEEYHFTAVRKGNRLWHDLLRGA